MQMFSLKKIAGFSLLEILVSVVIFSIGLMGLVAMQVSSIKLTNDAKYSSTASTLAAEMIDRMRANTTEFLLGTTSSYNNPNQNKTANSNCLGLDNNGVPVANVCTNAQMALHDFYEWDAMLRGQDATNWHPTYTATLPNARGVVCIDSTPNDGAMPPGDPACDNIVNVGTTPVFAVKVWWNERDDQNGSVTKRYVTTVQP